MCKIDIHTSPWLASYLLVHGTLLLQIHVNENIECNPQLHGMTNHYEPLRTIKQKQFRTHQTLFFFKSSD